MLQTAVKKITPNWRELKTVIGSATETSKRARGLCLVKFCSQKHGKKKKYCNKHNAQILAAKDPISARYSDLKQNAAKRYKKALEDGRNPAAYEFSLTLSNFRDFATYYGLLNARGRYKFSLTIDRKNPDVGYHIYNIEAITKSQNSSKGRKAYVEYYQKLELEINGRTVIIDPNELPPF